MSIINEIIQGMQDTKKPSDYWAISQIEFPELQASHLVMQRNGQSVWQHTMAVIDLLASKENITLITLLSGLFHDLGKYRVELADDLSLPRFPGHDIESALIAEKRLLHWGTAQCVTNMVCRIVSTHMYDISHIPSDKTIRKFIADIGIDNVGNWFALRVADSESYALPEQHVNRFIQPFREEVMSYLSKQPGTDQPELPNPGTVGNMQIKGGDS